MAIVVSALSLLIGAQAPPLADGISSQASTLSINVCLSTVAPFLEKGLLHLGIAGILLVTWLLLRQYFE